MIIELSIKIHQSNLTKSLKISRPQLFPRACTSSPPSERPPSLIGACWGHMPRHMVAEDLANATLVELQRRAWHMRPLTFMISQRRGYSFSECETRLVELLGNPQRFPQDTRDLPLSRHVKNP